MIYSRHASEASHRPPLPEGEEGERERNGPPLSLSLSETLHAARGTTKRMNRCRFSHRTVFVGAGLVPASASRADVPRARRGGVSGRGEAPAPTEAPVTRISEQEGERRSVRVLFVPSFPLFLSERGGGSRGASRGIPPKTGQLSGKGAPKVTKSSSSLLCRAAPPPSPSRPREPRKPSPRFRAAAAEPSADGTVSPPFEAAVIGFTGRGTRRGRSGRSGSSSLLFEIVQPSPKKGAGNCARGDSGSARVPAGGSKSAPRRKARGLVREVEAGERPAQAALALCGVRARGAACRITTSKPLAQRVDRGIVSGLETCEREPARTGGTASGRGLLAIGEAPGRAALEGGARFCVPRRRRPRGAVDQLGTAWKHAGEPEQALAAYRRELHGYRDAGISGRRRRPRQHRPGPPRHLRPSRVPSSLPAGPSPCGGGGMSLDER